MYACRCVEFPIVTDFLTDVMLKLITICPLLAPDPTFMHLQGNIYDCCATIRIYFPPPNTTETSMSIEGQDDFLITYPANVDSGSFVVNVYTTSKIMTFEVVDDDEISGDIYTIFRSYHAYEVVAKYEVGIAPLRFYKRNYIIHATNMEGKFRTQKIQLLKADSKERHVVQFVSVCLYLSMCGWCDFSGLDVSINPEKLQVVEGFLAVIDCLARGSLIQAMEWSRDYEPLDHKKVTHGGGGGATVHPHSEISTVIIPVHIQNRDLIRASSE